MVYVIDQAGSGRNSRTGHFVHWDAKVPDVSHRARITRAFEEGAKKTGKKVVYGPSRFSGNGHLWREKRFGDAILCSDKSRSALNPQGLKRIAGFNAKPVRH